MTYPQVTLAGNPFPFQVGVSTRSKVGVTVMNEKICTIPGCRTPVYVILSYTVPVLDPHPDVVVAYDPGAAVSTGWTVECENGHVLWTHTDQVKATNAAGLTELDEAGDDCPEFLPEFLPGSDPALV